jgi:hypothetical protein
MLPKKEHSQNAFPSNQKGEKEKTSEGEGDAVRSG